MDLTSRLASSGKPRRARSARTVEWKIDYGGWRADESWFSYQMKVKFAGPAVGQHPLADGTSTVIKRLSIALLVVTGTC